MGNLSVKTVQKKLIESDKNRHVNYEKMKQNMHPHAIHSLDDNSTKITQVKQINMPKDQHSVDKKGQPLFKQADFAGDYVDKMDRGIFETDKSDKITTPKVERMKPNQAPTQKKVNHPIKNTGGSSKMDVVPGNAKIAGDYIDMMKKGDIFSNPDTDKKVVPPKAKDLHSTTRPHMATKKADMERNPVKDAKGPSIPSDNFPMPSDAPKKRTVQKLKSGVLVRVNESVKARFDIVSDTVLNRMINNYKKYGYKAVVEQSNIQPKWKKDNKFLTLVREMVSAKENKIINVYENLRNKSLNRLYTLCKSDFNNLYENRNEFTNTIYTAFKLIESNAFNSYRDNLNLYIGNARIVQENGNVNDIELLSKATDHNMAARMIRSTILEQFGLNTSIKHIFVDGKKFLPHQINEWISNLKENVECLHLTATPEDNEGKKYSIKAKDFNEVDNHLNSLHQHIKEHNLKPHNVSIENKNTGEVHHAKVAPHGIYKKTF